MDSWLNYRGSARPHAGILSAMYRLGLVFTLSALAAFAQPSLESKLDEVISSALKTSGAPSVSVSVVDGGKLVYAKAFGKADIEKNRDATPDTRYAVGSISKQFTAAALLLIQEQ